MKTENFITKLIGGTVFFLTRIIFRPVVHFENGTKGVSAPLNGSTLIISNHINHLDGTTVAWLYRKYVVRSLAAKDRFEQGGFVGWYLEHTRCIPIDRVGVSTDWLHKSVQVLRKGEESISIFPEGRHETDGEVLPFHSGVTMIALMSGVPMVMVYIGGPYKFGRRLRIMVSEPFRLTPPENGMTPDYVAEQTEALRVRMEGLKKRLEAALDINAA